MTDGNTISMTEKQKVKEITDRLEEGLKELFESEKYKSYLSTMSKFHNYSFNNTLLIAMQKPEATLVAGYQAWQKNFNRHVNRGEKGIRILAPAPYKIKEERNKLDPVTGEVMLDEDGMPQTEEVEIKIPAFRAVSVFDVSQTDGEPIPELEAKELLSTVEGYGDFIKAITYVAPVPIDLEDIPGDSKGYFDMAENRIVVREGMGESQTLKTMVHETAHSMLHKKEIGGEDIPAPAKDRNTKEVEAESIAYTVCQHFGIDTSEYSFGYIAGWSSGKDMKELRSSLDTIRRTASELITGIEGQLKEIQREKEVSLPWEMMQEQPQKFILMVSDAERSHFDITGVKGMEGAKLVDSLLAMKDMDRENVEAYLESMGAWVIHLGDDRSGEAGEFHVDYIYDANTHEITDAKYAVEMDRKANEPIRDGSVVPTGHEGIFGTEKGAWENEGELHPVQAGPAESSASKEAQLLYGSSARYGIYQLKDIPELRDFHFAGTAELLKMGMLSDDFGEIQPGNYNLVYTGELSGIDGQTQREKLDTIFEKFNIDHPEDFKGHSLSVSDIVVLHENGGNSAHFVDAFGFMELPGFIRILEGVKEQGIERTEPEEMRDTSNQQMVAVDYMNAQKSETEQIQMEQSEVEKSYLAVYGHTLNYAIERGEIQEYEASRTLDRECKEAIEETIRQNFDGMHLKHDIVKPLVEQYGSERIAFVLVNTLRQESWDGRFSRNNKTWASEFSILKNTVHEMDMDDELIVSSHPAVLDGFIDMFRREALEREKELPVGQEKVTLSPHVDMGCDMDVQKFKTERSEPEQTQEEQTEAGKSELPTQKSEPEKFAETPEVEDVEDGDEIIDLGDEKDQVLAEMRQALEGRQDTDRIEPQAQGDVIENFKAKTNELFHEISEMNPAEIEETVKCHVQAKLEECGIDAGIVDVVVAGSRCRGLEREGSDLDVVVELSTNEREDVLFHMFNSDGLHIGGVKVDINPITAQRTGSLETYLPQVEDYLEGVREAREKEPISIFDIRMNDEERWFRNASGLDAEGLCKAYAECDKPFVEMGKYGERIGGADYAYIEQGDRLGFSIEFNEETDQITIFDGEKLEQKGLRATLYPEQAETEVTLTVAECGEFHNIGEFYENIPTVGEAVAIWEQIPPERMNVETCVLLSKLRTKEYI